ncbi:hypothetical protein Q4F19_04290 [Sphingomonas sp. BIUV-7]|uniref:Uncharacterized protein n=1 Tax=Sphingomonas natans TaxID=3063330 RepID=A0ABT8Y7C9_9SPHN|nr:hypothetical protein [Sphingomonas sp. BIUV-7]MDO6413595.1 hypothetical protein [Sphingomonas sp. BIUV-7]
MRFRPYQWFVEPLLALALRRRRLAALGFDGPVPEVAIDWRREADCEAPCPVVKSKVPRLVERYVARRAGRDDPLRLMPMVIDLARYPDAAAFDAALKARSTRTLPKIRKAEREGYVVRPFLVQSHVFDIHAIRTSMPMRSAGPVLDYWLLKPEKIATPATQRHDFGWPACPVHWIIWWGVFLPEPGYRQGEVEVGERLVAFVKMWRMGDIVHYTEIMGHRDHLEKGVMLLLHRAIVQWLIAGELAAAQGARLLLYGALEHGRAGLLTWKKRAGFRPVRMVADAVEADG